MNGRMDRRVHALRGVNDRSNEWMDGWIVTHSHFFIHPAAADQQKKSKTHRHIMD